jgi:hypothetical protein
MLIVYYREHAITYVRLLDAEADGGGQIRFHR